VFLFLSKFVPHFVYPLGLSLLLLISGILLFKRTRWGRILCLGALALLVIFSSQAISNALLSSLEDQYPKLSVEAAPQAQAIAILAGLMVRGPSPSHRTVRLGESGDRLLVGFQLYRAGKAPLVLLSGGNVPFLNGSGDVPESRAASQLLQEWGVPANAILVEDASRNTRENATYSYRLLNPRGIRQILLVTSASHLPRAAAAFRKVGFHVTPVPADFRTGESEADLFLRWLPSAASLRQSQTALQEWLGIFVYRLRGWA
jgi:uncharacterized SAM-binding protein YcdF (DUF218 family)